jgi:hypothetical protein
VVHRRSAAKLLGQVGHLLEVCRPPRKKPPSHLVGAVGRLPLLGKPAAQPLGRSIQQMFEHSGKQSSAGRTSLATRKSQGRLKIIGRGRSEF